MQPQHHGSTVVSPAGQQTSRVKTNTDCAHLSTSTDALSSTAPPPLRLFGDTSNLLRPVTVAACPPAAIVAIGAAPLPLPHTEDGAFGASNAATAPAALLKGNSARVRSRAHARRRTSRHSRRRRHRSQDDTAALLSGDADKRAEASAVPATSASPPTSIATQVSPPLAAKTAQSGCDAAAAVVTAQASTALLPVPHVVGSSEGPTGDFHLCLGNSARAATTDPRRRQENAVTPALSVGAAHELCTAGVSEANEPLQEHEKRHIQLSSAARAQDDASTLPQHLPLPQRVDDQSPFSRSPSGVSSMTAAPAGTASKMDLLDLLTRASPTDAQGSGDWEATVAQQDDTWLCAPLFTPPPSMARRSVAAAARASSSITAAEDADQRRFSNRNQSSSAGPHGEEQSARTCSAEHGTPVHRRLSTPTALQRGSGSGSPAAREASALASRHNQRDSMGQHIDNATEDVEKNVFPRYPSRSPVFADPQCCRIGLSNPCEALRLSFPSLERQSIALPKTHGPTRVREASSSLTRSIFNDSHIWGSDGAVSGAAAALHMPSLVGTTGANADVSTAITESLFEGAGAVVDTPPDSLDLSSFRTPLSPCPSSVAPSFAVFPCATTSRVTSPVSIPAKMVQQRQRERARARFGSASPSTQPSPSTATVATNPLTAAPHARSASLSSQWMLREPSLPPCNNSSEPRGVVVGCGGEGSSDGPASSLNTSLSSVPTVYHRLQACQRTLVSSLSMPLDAEAQRRGSTPPLGEDEDPCEAHFAATARSDGVSSVTASVVAAGVVPSTAPQPVHEALLLHRGALSSTHSSGNDLQPSLSAAAATSSSSSFLASRRPVTASLRISLPSPSPSAPPVTLQSLEGASPAMRASSPTPHNPARSASAALERGGSSPPWGDVKNAPVMGGPSGVLHASCCASPWSPAPLRATASSPAAVVDNVWSPRTTSAGVSPTAVPRSRFTRGSRSRSPRLQQTVMVPFAADVSSIAASVATSEVHVETPLAPATSTTGSRGSVTPSARGIEGLSGGGAGVVDSLFHVYPSRYASSTATTVSTAAAQQQRHQDHQPLPASSITSLNTSQHAGGFQPRLRLCHSADYEALAFPQQSREVTTPPGICRGSAAAGAPSTCSTPPPQPALPSASLPRSTQMSPFGSPCGSPGRNSEGYLSFRTAESSTLPVSGLDGRARRSGCASAVEPQPFIMRAVQSDAKWTFGERSLFASPLSLTHVGATPAVSPSPHASQTLSPSSAAGTTAAQRQKAAASLSSSLFASPPPAQALASAEASAREAAIGVVCYGVESELCGLRHSPSPRAVPLASLCQLSPFSSPLVVPSPAHARADSNSAGHTARGDSAVASAHGDVVTPTAEKLHGAASPHAARHQDQCEDAEESYLSSSIAHRTVAQASSASYSYASPLQLMPPPPLVHLPGTAASSALASFSSVSSPAGRESAQGSLRRLVEDGSGAEGSFAAVLLGEPEEDEVPRVWHSTAAVLSLNAEEDEQHATAAVDESRHSQEATQLPASEFHYAYSSLRGARSRQEDSVTLAADLPVGAGHVSHLLTDPTRHDDTTDDAVVFGCFAVFDGHCGDTVSSLASQYFPEHFEYAVREYRAQWAEERSRLRRCRLESSGSREDNEQRSRLSPAFTESGAKVADEVSDERNALSDEDRAEEATPARFQRVVSAALVQSLVHLDLTLYDELHQKPKGGGGGAGGGGGGRASSSQQRRDAGSTASVAAFFKAPSTRSTDTATAKSTEHSQRGTADSRQEAQLPEEEEPLVEDTYRLCIANLGDSRAIIGNKLTRQVLLSTVDHRISACPTEQARIEAAGGVVELGRVDGSLDVTRGLGDYRYKVDPRHWWATAAAAAAAGSSTPLRDGHDIASATARTLGPLLHTTTTPPVTAAALACASSGTQTPSGAAAAMATSDPDTATTATASSTDMTASSTTTINSSPSLLGDTPENKVGKPPLAARALRWQSMSNTPLRDSLESERGRSALRPCAARSTSSGSSTSAEAAVQVVRRLIGEGNEEEEKQQQHQQSPGARSTDAADKSSSSDTLGCISASVTHRCPSPVPLREGPPELPGMHPERYAEKPHPFAPATAPQPSPISPITALTGNAVSNIADVYEWEVHRDDVLIMASDGVWDTMTSEEVLQFVCHELQTAEREEEEDRVAEASAAEPEPFALPDSTGEADTPLPLNPSSAPTSPISTPNTTNAAIVEAGTPCQTCRPSAHPQQHQQQQRTPQRPPTSARFATALCTPCGDGGGRSSHSGTPGDLTSGSGARSSAVQNAARHLTEHVVHTLSGSDNTTVIVVAFR